MMTPENGTAARQTNRERMEQLAGIAVLGLLVVGVVAVLRPFVASLFWALILSMATWPLFAWFEQKLGGRPTPAATVMTLRRSAEQRRNAYRELCRDHSEEEQV